MTGVAAAGLARAQQPSRTAGGRKEGGLFSGGQDLAEEEHQHDHENKIEPDRGEPVDLEPTDTVAGNPTEEGVDPFRGVNNKEGEPHREDGEDDAENLLGGEEGEHGKQGRVSLRKRKSEENTAG